MKNITELNPHHYPTTSEIDNNLAILFARIMQLQELAETDIVVTSGLRSDAQQQALIKAGKSAATKSRHLTGQAVDILDVDGKLANWIKWHMRSMEQLGLWFEDFNSTRGWVHAQIVQPKSGKRVFIP